MSLLSRFTLLVFAVSLSACTHQPWHGREGDTCHIELINETGGVALGITSPTVSEPVLTGDPGLDFKSVTSDGQTTLTVIKPDNIPASDIEFLVPPECNVAISTTAGEVTVENGSEIPSLTVHTTVGDITLRITPETNADIRLATSGEITSDFTIDIDFKYHEEPAKHGQVVTGMKTNPGTPDVPINIQLRSLRGSVSVLRAN